MASKSVGPKAARPKSHARTAARKAGKPKKSSLRKSKDPEPSPARAAETATPRPDTPPPNGSAQAGSAGSKPDIEALTRNLLLAAQEGGRALATSLQVQSSPAGAMNAAGALFSDAAQTFGKIAEYWLSDPARTRHAQTELANPFIQLWSATLQRLNGGEAPPVVSIDPQDRRFSDPDWRTNPLFDFARQAYSLMVGWGDRLVDEANSVDAPTRERAHFLLKQIAGALSPSNFLPTNPELLRTTIHENAANLVRGMQMLNRDIEAGDGRLRIKQVDSSRFQLGVNMAATPGKVIFRNDLIELIQYTPTTAKALKRPLLVVPPWINKYYILDLNPEKSFVRWCVAQGLTMFVGSWVNPDERLAAKGFDAYMREGVLAALDAIERATGARDIAALGYCVGGTLLASTLAYMAAKNDRRISSATFLTTQVDFTDPGELKHFIDAERLRTIDETMAKKGYLEGAEMASAFNMLRPVDLIWNYVVNNYIRGREPPAFDLLTWNADSTRMPRANHSWYLREFYLENKLARGTMELAGVRLDLGKVTIPTYHLATREDHIAPVRSCFRGAALFGGARRFVASGSGHIAGVVNPPDKPKYQYWSNGAPSGDFDAWIAKARETPGSWWPDWLAWQRSQAPTTVAARHPGGGKLKPLGDAPGDYVRVKS